VPLVGLSAIICPLQALVVFADLPLAQNHGVVRASAGLGWGLMLASRRGRASLGTVPQRIILFALLAYLGQGVGVAAVGVARYRGNLHSDQYPYLVSAQFLMEEPFSLEWDTVGARPWLVVAMSTKNDRIGQSIVQGFLAVTAGRDSPDLFFPTLLLGPALMVPAVFLLGPQCGLPRRWTTWAALAAGAVPGVEYLVSMCFLSHTLCVPTLVAFLAGVIRLARGTGWRALPGTAAALVVGFAVYTEFVPIFAGSAGVALTAGLVYRQISLKRAAGVSAALVLACALNPAALVSARTVLERGTNHSGMRTNCRTSVWVAALWLHFEKAWLTGGRVDHTVAHLFFYSITGAAAVGGLVLATRAVRSGHHLAPALACVALLVPPIALRVVQAECEYMIGKLVLTLAPVAVVFLACGLHALSCVSGSGRGLARIVGGLVFAVFVVQSGLEQRARLRGGNDVGPAIVWNDPHLQELCKVLASHPKTDVIIAIERDGDARYPATASGAVCFYGRHHRIRLAAPLRVWAFTLEEVPAPQLARIAELSPGTLLVTRTDPHQFTSAAFEPVVQNASYQLVRLLEPGTVRPESPAYAHRVP
jgi:hypothetical protein